MGIQLRPAAPPAVAGARDLPEADTAGKSAKPSAALSTASETQSSRSENRPPKRARISGHSGCADAPAEIQHRHCRSARPAEHSSDQQAAGGHRHTQTDGKEGNRSKGFHRRRLNQHHCACCHQQISADEGMRESAADEQGPTGARSELRGQQDAGLTVGQMILPRDSGQQHSQHDSRNAQEKESAVEGDHHAKTPFGSASSLSFRRHDPCGSLPSFASWASAAAQLSSLE